MNLVLIGPPGSGKGTQAQLLVKKFALVCFSPGEVLRDLVKQATPLAHQIDKIMKEGGLIPNKIMVQIMNSYFAKKKLSQGILFDGFPRNVFQAKMLDQWLRKRETTLDWAIYLFVSQKAVVKRLSSRLECPECEATFNLLTKPPKNDERCDFCQIPLIRRSDDQPATIAKRFKTFQNETAPLVEFYRKKGVLEEIDGERLVKVIFEDIVGRLKSV